MIIYSHQSTVQHIHQEQREVLFFERCCSPDSAFFQCLCCCQVLSLLILGLCAFSPCLNASRYPIHLGGIGMSGQEMVIRGEQSTLQLTVELSVCHYLSAMLHLRYQGLLFSVLVFTPKTVIPQMDCPHRFSLCSNSTIQESLFFPLFIAYFSVSLPIGNSVILIRI